MSPGTRAPFSQQEGRPLARPLPAQVLSLPLSWAPVSSRQAAGVPSQLRQTAGATNQTSWHQAARASPGDSAASSRGPCGKRERRSPEPPPEHLLPGPAPPRSLWDAGRWGPAAPSSDPSFPLEGPHAPRETVPDSDSVKSNLSPGTLGALCHSALWVKHLRPLHVPLSDASVPARRCRPAARCPSLSPGT